MYVTAQRVVSSARPDGRRDEGINAFYHLHGSFEWDDQPPPRFMPESDPGVPTDSHVEVRPPGNRVRSYLDIVAPDATPLTDIMQAVAAVPTPTQLPVKWLRGPVFCRLGVELGLASSWRRELQRLSARVVLLLRQQPEFASY